jgi:hypothetical protein
MITPPTPRSVTPISFGARGLLLVLVPTLLAAQGPVTGTVAGRVTARADSGSGTAPAGGAVVSIVGTPLGTNAGTDGRFAIDRVPAGAVTVRVRRLGYATTERLVRVRAGDTTRVDVTLVPGAQLLQAIRTDARSADLERFLSRPSVGTITMSSAAMAGIPGIGEPDLVRTVQLLPGVGARNDFNATLNVRGGEADQNLVLLDGYPIYNPFHLGGLFSTFMDATVGDIELMTAAFPASLGGRLSSVLDVRSRDEARAGVHGSADVSVLATTGRLAGAFDRGRGSWSVAGRRTYADALTSLFTTSSFPYHFRDFHGRAAYELSSSVRVALTAYGGRDVLDANMAELEGDSVASRASQGRWAFDWGNRVVGASITKELGADARLPLLGWQLGDGTTLEQRVSSSSFNTLLDVGEGALSQRSEISDLRLAGSAVARGARHDRSLGYEVSWHRIRYASGAPQTGTSSFDIVQRPTTGALWIGDLWRISPRWLAEGGLRAEAVPAREWMGLSPRLSLKYFATPELAFTAAAGRVSQSLHSLAGDGPLRYFDIWIASDSFLPVATAWHYVLGAERRVLDAGSVRVEGFVKRFYRVQEANRLDDPQRRGDEFLTADGRASGVDLLARWQPASGLAGWIAYSYGVSERWRDTLRWAPGHDRRHDLDVVAIWHLARYRMGARFGLQSGTPYTPIVGGITRRVYDPSLDRWGTGEPVIEIEALGGSHNSERFPVAHRLDLDVSREFQRGGATITPYVSVANAYNAKNVFVYLYQYSTDAPTRRAISQFPVLPSAGVRVAF